jgi:hypothetical protein
MAASRTTPSSSLRSSRRAVRTRLVLLLVLLVPLVALAVGVATTPRATDFNCFWSGARIVLDGGDPYDRATWTAATGADVVDLFGTARETHCPIGYGYPLTTAIALIPLGALPIGVAIVIWQAMFVLGLGVGLALLARAARLAPAEAILLAILVVASQPLEYEFIDVRFGGLLVLAAGLLATSEAKLLDGGPVIGTLLAALKPHVMPLAVLVRLRELGSVLSIAVALAPLYVLGGASLIVDPGWPVKWIAELLGHRLDMATSGQSATLWMLSRVVGIPAVGPLLMGLGIASLGIALWRARGRTERLDAIAVAIVGWAIVVPYALSGDHLVALSVTAAAVLPRATPVLTVSLFAIGGVLPWLLYGTRYDVLAYRGLEVTSALVPVALALLLAAALWGRRVPDARPLAQAST